MPIEVTMPKLSPTMETGVIAQWLVKVGDQVKEGDSLADIETDKATMPMKSYDDGTIVHHRPCRRRRSRAGPAGDGSGQEGRRPKKVVESLGLGQEQAPAGGEASAAKPATVPASGGAARATRPATASRRRPLEERNRWGAAEGQSAGAEGGGGVAGRAGPGARLGPRRPDHPPRRRGVSPGRAQGAPHRGGGAHQAGADAAAPQASRSHARDRPSTAPATQRIPHTRMRKTIAQRMPQAKQAAPEIHLTIDARVDRLAAAREELNKRLARDGSSSRSATSSPRPSPWPCGFIPA